MGLGRKGGHDRSVAPAMGLRRKGAYTGSSELGTSKRKLPQQSLTCKTESSRDRPREPQEKASSSSRRLSNH